MIQKIVSTGSSAAVTIPAGFLTKLDLAIGDEVSVDVDLRKRMIYIKPLKNVSLSVEL